MKVKLFWFVLFVLCIAISPIQAQPISCLDTFRAFTPIEPEIHPTARNESYGHIAAWYTDSRCIVVGSETGLWMYDIDQPDSPLQLAEISERAISNIAVNLANSTIAFNVAQEPTVYLIHPGGTSESLGVSGQAVTAIAFSPDGALMAAASAQIDDEIGLYYEPYVELWNSSNQHQAELVIDELFFVVAGIFFSSDSSHLLTDNLRQGYEGNDPYYWDTVTSSQIWSYNDLFRSIQNWSDTDPLAPSQAIMHDNTVAFAGLGGYVNFNEYSDLAIQIWDAEEQKRIREIVVYWRGSSVDDPGLVDITFNSDGSQIVSSQSDGTIKFWNVASGEQVGQIDTHLDSLGVSFSPDDRFLAVRASDEIQIWDIAQKRVYSIIQL